MAADDDDDALLGVFEDPPADDHPATIAARVMRHAEHSHLAEYEIRFLWLMRATEHIQAGRRVIGMVHEPQVQGRLKDLFLQMLVKAYGFMPDFIVTLDQEWWRSATPLQREALVWHELAHVKHAVDKNGELRFNRDTGEPIMALVAHDLEEFNSTVERYGAWKDDIREFIAAAERHG